LKRVSISLGKKGEGVGGWKTSTSLMADFNAEVGGGVGGTGVMALNGRMGDWSGVGRGRRRGRRGWERVSARMEALCRRASLYICYVRGGIKEVRGDARVVQIGLDVKDLKLMLEGLLAESFRYLFRELGKRGEKLHVLKGGGKYLFLDTLLNFFLDCLTNDITKAGFHLPRDIVRNAFKEGFNIGDSRFLTSTLIVYFRPQKRHL
jgi:hypothetical protein